MKTGPYGVPSAYLERFPEAGGPAERISLWKLPFTIGRSETADHTVYSGKVSKEHVTIEVADGRYVVRDLESTNGTFVNGERASTHFLEDGDILHVAHIEFFFRHAQAVEQRTPTSSGSPSRRSSWSRISRTASFVAPSSCAS